MRPNEVFYLHTKKMPRVVKPLLHFEENGDLLVISGKSFYMKDHLKELKIGARFDPANKSWTVPLKFDTESLRQELLDITTKNIAKELDDKKKQKEDEQKRLAYNATPEGKAELKEARKAKMRACLQEDKKRMARGETPLYWWVCCEDCELLSYKRGVYHTCCWTCADWNGAWWEPFMKNGTRHTGD
jgi:hypothetical protein